jgi:ubiquinone/menaquinone biosynthesis C-methylase UbiE
MRSMDRDDSGNRAGAFFEAASASYDREYDRPGAAGRTLRRRMEATLRLLGDEAGEVLDAGMGGGRLCVELDRRGWTVSGIDLSSSMVALAQTRLPQVRERLVHGSVTELPFVDETFDAVVATGVLEFVGTDLGKAVGELARVLRPAGIAVVSFPNRKAPPIIWRRRVLYPAVRLVKRLLPVGKPPPPRAVLLPMDALRGALAATGLEIEVTVGVGVGPTQVVMQARRVR